MAGTPEFSRSKRYKFFHTTHETTFEGSESVHVKGAHTASIDGNQNEAVSASHVKTVGGNQSVTVTGNRKVVAANASVNAPQDFKNNPVYNVRGGNVGFSRKASLTTANLTNASADQRVCLFSAAEGDTLHDVFAKVNTGFKYGATATICRLQVGIKTDINGFANSHLCGSVVSGIIMEGQTNMTDKGTLLCNASIRTPYVFTAAASIMAQVTASSCLVASLEQGDVDVFFNMTPKQA